MRYEEIRRKCGLKAKLNESTGIIYIKIMRERDLQKRIKRVNMETNRERGRPAGAWIEWR